LEDDERPVVEQAAGTLMTLPAILAADLCAKFGKFPKTTLD
jgi:hypothetical protein